MQTVTALPPMTTGGDYMTETLNQIVQLISNVGFPIACVCVMFYEQEQERKNHKEECDSWVEALNRNTLVIEKLSAKLGVDTNGIS